MVYPYHFLMEIKAGGRFHLIRRVGAGSFGEVYLGEDIKTKEKVAIKLEPNKTGSPQLSYESKLYIIFSGGVSIPKFHWFGNEANYRVMVIDYLGKSLEDLFQLCHQRFSLKTVLMIAEQTISALEFIHIRRFIHRDVKPDNFMIGSGNKKNQIYVIDFGLSKKYCDQKTGLHIKFVDGKSLTGTARYASINALKGYEQSRRDDLEALGYCFLYFLRGSLPWMGLPAKDRKEKYEKIRSVKTETTLEELCKGFPPEFLTYMQMVRSLEFTQEPEYAKYRKLFRDCFIREGYVYDYQYDWVNNDIIKSTKQNDQQSKKESINFSAMHSDGTKITDVNIICNDEEQVIPRPKEENAFQSIPKPPKAKNTPRQTKSPVPSQPFSCPQNNRQTSKQINSNKKNPLLKGRSNGTQGKMHRAAVPTGWSFPKPATKK